MLADKCEGLTMVDLIGDLCIPSELIVPAKPAGTNYAISGSLFLSGAKLYVSLGGQGRLVTTAT
jgi:hypothetical protein